MFQRLVLGSLISIFISSASFAISFDGWLKYSCGDHWLSIDVYLNPINDSAVVDFKGDSSPNRSEIPAVYKLHDSENTITVDFMDPTGGSLELTREFFQREDIWWSRLALTKASDLNDFGSCSKRI